jgi:hypothetical protein
MNERRSEPWEISLALLGLIAPTNDIQREVMSDTVVGNNMVD